MWRRRVVLLVIAVLCGGADGRDFPKTLIFDEPGIDDEVSLPTLSGLPGARADAAFELDKRLTTWLSLQLNTGYTALLQPGANAYGWQNTSATLKSLLLVDDARERIVSFSLTREFGGSGAARVGAARTGATTAGVNVGQGATPWTTAAWLQPFAVTGTLGVAVPDAARAARQVLVGASLQYSLAVLRGTPARWQPFIPIVEFSCAQPSVMLAPGLIYAGRGYQLAAELLVPLMRQTGMHVGGIAQLNISLGPGLKAVLF